MKRILILGVNGFIGHHLSKRIVADTDWEIYGMDMQTERIADLLGERRFHFFEGDITINREWIEYHVKKCDVVLPLVAIATPIGGRIGPPLGEDQGRFKTYTYRRERIKFAGGKDLTIFVVDGVTVREAVERLIETYAGHTSDLGATKVGQ